MLKITLQVNNEEPLLRLAAINRGHPEGFDANSTLRNYEIVKLGNGRDINNENIGTIQHYRENGAVVLTEKVLKFYRNYKLQKAIKALENP